MKTVGTHIIMIFTALAVVLLLAAAAGGQFYRYVDKNGNSVYVDDLGKVPPEFREDLKVYKERLEHLAPNERALRLEREGRMRREAEAAEAAAAEAQRKQRELENSRTRIVIDGNKVMVPVTLGFGGAETEAMLVLDTGASIIALHREVSERLFIETFDTLKLRVVGGNIIEADTVLLDYVKVGPHLKKEIQVGIIDHQGTPVSYEGLLGMNFLRDIAYRIDFTNQFIYWPDGEAP